MFAYFGINPSTADANTDDRTVNKWTGFTERNGGKGFIVGNVFPLRSKDVKRLGKCDPCHEENKQHIEAIIDKADVLVPCWGNTKKIPKHLRPQISLLMSKLVESGKPVKVFGYTKNGDPVHPLMLGYSTPLIDYCTN